MVPLIWRYRSHEPSYSIDEVVASGKVEGSLDQPPAWSLWEAGGRLVPWPEGHRLSSLPTPAARISITATLSILRS